MFSKLPISIAALPLLYLVLMTESWQKICLFLHQLVGIGVERTLKNCLVLLLLPLGVQSWFSFHSSHCCIVLRVPGGPHSELLSSVLWAGFFTFYKQYLTKTLGIRSSQTSQNQDNSRRLEIRAVQAENVPYRAALPHTFLIDYCSCCQAKHTELLWTKNNFGRWCNFVWHSAKLNRECFALTISVCSLPTTLQMWNCLCDTVGQWGPLQEETASYRGWKQLSPAQRWAFYLCVCVQTSKLLLRYPIGGRV